MKISFISRLFPTRASPRNSFCGSVSLVLTTITLTVSNHSGMSRDVRVKCNGVTYDYSISDSSYYQFDKVNPGFQTIVEATDPFNPADLTIVFEGALLVNTTIIL